MAIVKVYFWHKQKTNKVEQSENITRIPSNWKEFLQDIFINGEEKISHLHAYFESILEPDFIEDEINRFKGYLEEITKNPNWISRYKKRLNGIIETDDITFFAVEINGDKALEKLNNLVEEYGSEEAVMFNSIKKPLNFLARFFNKNTSESEQPFIKVIINASEFAFLFGHLIKIGWFAEPDNKAYTKLTKKLLQVFEVKNEDGLIASNQIQQATNFIRYATKSVTPSATTSLANYDKLYAQAVNTDGSVAEVDKIKAQHALSTYLANLKTYAAINSVPISNLYYLLSNRMPQESKDGKTQSSQALSEFEMATKRLYDPKKESGSQWIDQINAASAATVQKEIAVLLSELNYQIYLMNQKTDRMLLTQSLALLQVSNAQMPILEVAETEEAVNAE